LEKADQITSKLDGSLGIFTIVAMILLLWGFCWLKSYAPLQTKQYVNVLFTEVGGLREGANVYVDGVRAGSVDSISWQEPHKVIVRISITNSKMTILKGSQFNILANAVIGARYVDILLPTGENLEPIDQATIVRGGYVVRPEIILHKIGLDIDRLDLDAMQRNLNEDGRVFRNAASKFSQLSDNVVPVMKKALPLEDSLIILSGDLRVTANKLDKFIDNPKLSPDLKQTIKEARQTAQIAQSAIHELNNTLADKSMRKDLFDTIHQLNESTNHLEKAMERLQQIGQDTQFRSDIKEILLDARKTLEKLDKLLNNPDSGADVRSTLKETRTTLEDVDTAARQLEQIMDKPHPLIHMFMGRPGHLKVKSSEIEVQK
jgi:phospholipid/cholesterol/gamma-HCH transport system substrate-binding protein